MNSALFLIALLCCYTTIRQQLCRPVPICLEQLRCFRQHPRQVLVRVKAVLLRSLYEAVDYSAALCPIRRVGEQEILSPYDERLDASLGEVVAYLQTPVLKVTYEIWPLRPQIVQSLTQRGLRRGALCFCPYQKRVQNRLRPFPPLRCFISVWQVVYLGLYPEQCVAVRHTLGSCAALALFFRNRVQRFNELASRVCPAAYYTYALVQLVVAIVPIRVQPALEPLEELLRILCLAVRPVLIQYNLVLGVYARPVQPHVALALCALAGFFQYLSKARRANALHC